MKAAKHSIIGVILSLLIIGIVSSTPIRHAIQMVPLLVVYLLMEKPWSQYASLAVLLFWLIIMLLIWLFLLGLSNIARGTYSSIEIISTMIIGASCLIGIISSLKRKTSSKRLHNIVAFAAFLILQITMMWISFLGSISDS